MRYSNKISLKIYSTLLTFSIVSTLHATPPRVSWIEEEIIGANDQYLYSLRSIVDNSGTYYVDSRDTYLVEIEISSGAFHDKWPVRSSITDTVNATPGSVTETARLNGLVNPYDILRDKGAAPWGTHHTDENSGYKFKNGDLITNFNDPTGESGAKTLITALELAELMQASHAAILASYPEMTDEMIMDMSGQYIGVPSLDHVVSCEIKQQARPLGVLGEVGVVPLVLDCILDEDIGLGNDLIVFVPQWQAINQ